MRKNRSSRGLGDASRDFRGMWPHAAALLAAVLVASPGAKAQSCAPGVNPIVCENSQPGNTGWDVSGSGDPTIQGFATDISVNVGGTIYFKVSTPASNYHIDIYRIGYYGDTGARKIASITPSVSLPQSQPACLSDPSTNLFDCGNWAISASWQVPTTAVSGLYAADLIRNDTGGASQMWFVVRNDASTSDILVQTSDETWQAYNNYGGHSLYGDTGFNLPNRAYKVSYNRPFNTRSFEAATFLYNAEYPMVRWLEANGYDVSYFTGVDAARNGSLIKNHKIYISSGHDEYWSGPHRASVEAARDAGVNLAFFSGNEMFWKTRWENSIDGTSTPYRTLVCYKETLDGSSSAGGGIPDPLDPPTWTGTWRDPSKSPPADGGRPENAVTGTIFAVNGPGSDNTNLSIQVPAADGKMRFWRNTSIATQSAGQVATLPAGTLGYEWDIDADNGFRPAGTFDLATSTHTLTTDLLLDYGGIYGAGTATHHITMHRAPSGALVFGAGTVQWAWGLDANHDGSGGGTDVRMQQATVNLFADMGVEPGTLQSGLVAASKSTDFNAPASTISSPASGSTQQLGIPVTISGTAVDFGSGVVGGVEVSTDGGVTWHAATGRETWTYTWMPVTSGTINLLSRAVDDSANLETPSAGVTVTVPKPAISTDVNVSKDGGTASTTITSPTFSTGSANELLLAFISTDYLTGANTTVTGVSGGGLTWVLAVRTNNQSGTSETWRAFAPSQMSNISVTATISQSVISTITVMSFAGVDTSGTNGSGAIGAKASGSAASGAPTATLTTTRNGSLIFAVGNDYDNAIPRTPANGQSLVHQLLSAAGDTYWVQMLDIPVPTSGTSVTVSDTAPTSDRYNLSVVEILASTGSTQQFSISGTVSPIPAGAGVTLTLSGATIGTATSDSSGNYTFTGLVNGSYTVTPNKVGYGFTPPSQAVTVSGANVSNVSFTASALPSISGSISPLPGGSGVTVTLSAQSEGGTGGTVTSDTSGNFTFSGVVNGTYTITPTKTGFSFNPASQTVTVSGANITSVNFTATANSTYTISGVVSPVAAGNGTTLTLSGAGTGTATGNASGNYSFTNLANGTYTVTPSRSGYTFSPASQTVTVSGANITGVNFTATANPTYTISGTVSPVSVGNGTTLTLSGAGTGTATGDASGNYSFANLANGTYIITPSLAGYIFSPASQTVVVNGANVTSINFTATAVPTWTISGNVAPVAAGNGATLTLSGAASAMATGDTSGNYSFANLPNGTYTLTPSRSGYSFTPPNQTVTVNGANISGVNFTATPGLARDVTVSVDVSSASTTIKTAAFSTTAGNELLLAFVTADYISGTNTTVTGITGGGLTWVLVARSNTQSGNAEIWRAFAASPLANATVTATLSQSVVSSITVMSFTGVDTSGTNGSGAIGATKTANGGSGAPTASLVTTRNNSWVIGVGNDFDNAIARTLGSGQTVIHQDLTSTGDTYWVQMRSSTTPTSGTTVTVNDTAPTTDRWNLAICEILP